MAQVQEHERDLVLANEALQYLVTCLLGEDCQQLRSPTFPATPAFIARNTGVTIGIIPVGFYALKLWSRSEPIVCCIAGTPSDTTFYSLARKCFRRSTRPAIIVERSSPENAEFDLSINSVSIHIKYHQNPLMTRWSQLDSAASVNDSLEELPRESRRRFADVQAVNKAATILKGPTKSSNFWTTRRWALHSGLASHSFTGVANPELLAITLEAMEAIKDDKGEKDFLSRLCQMSLTPATISQKATTLGLQNATLTPNQCAILQRAQARTLDLQSRCSLDLSSTDWIFFLSSCKRYVKIDVSFWGTSSTKGGRFLQAVEYAISRLVKRLIKHYRNTAFHAWPRPFVSSSEESTADAQTAEQVYEASYFIGCDLLRRGEPVDENIFPDAESTSTWFDRELENSKWNDFSSAFASVQLVEKVDPSEWAPDTKERAPVPEEQRRDDSSDDEAEDLFVENLSIDDSMPAKPRAAPKTSKLKDAAQSLPSPGCSRPLRPALDILHRIQHDTSMDSSDFIIGYLDRHTGLLEMPLEWWVGKDATCEEFIPQSRIRYFKRKSDGVVVWDREERKDLVFGSGKTSESKSQ